MKSTEKINFTELAQKVNLKNKKGKWNVKILTSQQWKSVLKDGTGYYLSACYVL